MNKWLKSVNVLFVLFLLIGTNAYLVKPATDADYDITKIDVDDTTIFEGVATGNEPVVFVERGEEAKVEVWIQGNLKSVPIDDKIEDVKVKTWIGGYEFGDIEDTSEIFSVEDGITYKKTLNLLIPIDFELDKDTTLNIQVFDSDNSLQISFPLRIREKRHFLNIIDVIINPGLTTEAGKTLFGTTRVENLGEQTQRDIKIVMSIPELGLSTRTFIDELVNEREALIDNNDDRVSASSDELFLKIPENTREGTYTLKVQVIYNRGHTTEEKTFALNVKSGLLPVPSEAVIVTVDTLSQTVQPGKGTVFKVMVTNLDKKTMAFSVDVAGVSSWGNSRVDPALVTVAPDQSGEMFVFVSANENAQVRDNPITLTVKSNDKLVKQTTVNVKVVTDSLGTGTFGNLRRGLEIGFVILLVVLVILGLILAARKLGGKEEEEGKTYY